MKFEYCPKCGGRLTPKKIGDEGDVPFCGKCERPFFPFSYPCVICLCVNEGGEVVLIKQSYGADRFVCVAGYIREGESGEEAAVREISEEIGLRTLSVRFLYSKYYEKHDNLMLAYVCRVEDGEPVLSGEVKLARCFPAEEAAGVLPEGSYGREMLRLWREGGEAV